MFALCLYEDSRIHSAWKVLSNGNYDGMPIVETLPDGDISEYRYVGGEFVRDPLPKPSTVPVAPRNITEGEYVTVNGVLYKATTNIPNGASIITGQNAVATTIEEQLAELAKGE